MRLQSALLPWLLIGLAGCGWFGSRGVMDPRGPSLADVVADLEPLELPEPSAAAPSREEVMAAYRSIYGEVTDPRLDHAVGKRLADLSMSAGEDHALAGAAAPFKPAIELYESLLDRPDTEGQDEILYQLARAYDLTGDTDRVLRYLDRLIDEHPDSRYRVEARFRRGEIAFSAGRYAAAEADYAFVAAQGRGTPYWQNATYMEGWSRFKRSNLDGALDSFFAVIASLLPPGTDATLPTTERELLNDTLRVVTLALGYLDGAVTLAERMSARGRPDWQYLAYQALADYYQERERFLDSVAVWETFVRENPLDPRAPAAHLGVIETLLAANFPSEVLPRKEDFVRRYGIRSDFWAVHGPEVRQAYLEPLQAFLEELATLRHAAAQQSGERAAYLAAAAWYQELVETFPQHPHTAEYLFLLGEVYTEADEPAQAVAAYQRVMREFPDYPRANEAGYAAIIGLDRLVERAPADERELWARIEIDAQIEFAFTFAGDPRAPEVQTDATDALYRLAEYEQAVLLAENLLGAWPDLEWRLRRTALTVLGHGRFELGLYAEAETAYRTLLAGRLEDTEREALLERLLAAVYRQAETAEQAGAADAAIAHFLRLSEIAPDAPLAIQGRYDAVAVAEAAGRIERAAGLLDEFRHRHPDHPLARDAGKRLAAMYEQTGNGRAAADEYARLAESDPDPEVRRLSRYRAAELYLAEEDLTSAIACFRDYFQAHPEPADQRLEAAHQLDLLYQRVGDPDARRYWLEQKIAVHHAMGARAGERANYLAAEARFALAEEARAAFELVRLTHPLKQSLARKQRALTAAVDAYEAVIAYRVAEFATASTYRIGTLFSALARSIMESDRPDGLSELELEQYEILLEEQAFPFEERAIALHEINMRRSWEGLWDSWIEQSFTELRRLMPARFDKPEVDVAYVEGIH
ncbi:MAG TPA: tetratricopeptide repeat protein [Pseudomonadales bacterium]